MVCTMLILKKQICGMYRALCFALLLLKIQQKYLKCIFTAWSLHFLVVKCEKKKTVCSFTPWKLAVIFLRLYQLLYLILKIHSTDFSVLFNFLFVKKNRTKQNKNQKGISKWLSSHAIKYSYTTSPFFVADLMSVRICSIPSK